METFRAQDMQKQASALQEAAMKEPVLITYHDRPRLVLMSIDEYDRLRGRKRAAVAATETAPGKKRDGSPLTGQTERDVLIAYSRGQIARSDAMLAIGMDPSDPRAFAARMNALKIPWPKVEREQAEREAEELLEIVEGGS
jgi:prevent-host-death family protein